MKKRMLWLCIIFIFLFIGMINVDGAQADRDFLNSDGTKNICTINTKSSCNANSSCVWFEELGYGCLESEISNRTYRCLYSGIVEGQSSQNFYVMARFYDGVLEYAASKNWYKFDQKTQNSEHFVFSQEPLVINDPNNTTLKRSSGKKYFTCPDVAWIKTGTLVSELSNDKQKHYNSQIYFTRPTDLNGYKQVSLVKDPNYSYNGIMSIVNEKCYQCNGQSNLFHWGISPNGNSSSCPSGWHERLDLSQSQCGVSQDGNQSSGSNGENDIVNNVECKYKLSHSSLGLVDAPYTLKIYNNHYEVYDGSGSDLVLNKNASILNWSSDYSRSYYDSQSQTQATIIIDKFVANQLDLTSSSVCPSYMLYHEYTSDDDLLVHNNYNVLDRYRSIFGSGDYTIASLYLESGSVEEKPIGPGTQESVYGCEVIPLEIRNWIRSALNLVKYVALVLVIILGALDFIQAAVSGEADKMKKAGNSFVKRIIAVVILFLLPVIVELILGLIEIFGVDSSCLSQ